MRACKRPIGLSPNMTDDCCELSLGTIDYESGVGNLNNISVLLPVYTELGKTAEDKYPPTHEAQRQSPELVLTVSLDDPCRSVVRGRRIAHDTASDEAFTRIQIWLKGCLTRHKDCSPAMEANLPSFVLDVGDTHHGDTLRLVENDGSKMGSYAALSYVWGTPFSPELKDLYLNKTNRRRYLESVPEHELPKTLADAIVLTRQLGIRYLWIDALCIIQDDKAFKRKEIANMHKIYGDSSITIQAACAPSVYAGFLKKRVSHSLPSQKLRYSKAGDPNPGFVYIRPAEVSTQEGFTGTRAWCFEEGVLPTRLLVFGKEQMMYHCKTGSSREDGYKNPIGKTSTTKLFSSIPWYRHYPNITAEMRKPNPKLDLLKRWYNALDCWYTQRFLTNHGDRLPAIAGVATKLQDVIGGDYIAGIWKSDLPWGLLWQSRKGIGGKFFNGDIKREWVSKWGPERMMVRPLGQQRAPSWSWAAVDGATYHNFVQRIQDTNKVVTDVLRCPVVGANPFLGDLSDWRLVLYGPVKRAIVSPILRPAGELRQKFERRAPYAGDVTLLLPVSTPAPLPTEELERFAVGKFDICDEISVSVTCILITETMGLMLEPHGEQPKFFRRLGVFWNWNNFFDGEPKSEVTII